MQLKRNVPFNRSFVAGMTMMLIVAGVAVFHATTKLALLINISAMMIVFGGVFAASFVITPWVQLRDLAKKLFKYARFEPDSNWMVASEIVRAAILFSQKRSLTEIGYIQNRRLYDALELLESGLRKEDVTAILAVKRESSFSQSVSESGLLLSLAKLAPGLGLVGTLVGLVVLLGDIGTGNFDKVGPAMAIALLATLYGVFIANMIFMPIAEFIMHRAEAVSQMDELLERGVLSIMEGKHPVQIREMLRAYLNSYDQSLFDNEVQKARSTATSTGQSAKTDKNDEVNVA